MTKINEAILQLKADLEELMDHAEESEKALRITNEIMKKVFDFIKDKPKSEVNFSDSKPMIILIEEYQKKLMESMRSQARIITRVSPNLESHFEDWLLDYEKENNSALQILKSITEKGESPEQKITENIQRMPEYFQRMQDANWTGHIIQDNIKISRTIIESIMKRLEE